MNKTNTGGTLGVTGARGDAVSFDMTSDDDYVSVPKDSSGT
jgi:hypothetical protein